jgi:glycosyltransferase involved in cell wall biosynthesis
MSHPIWQGEVYATPPAANLRPLHQVTDPYVDCPVDVTFFVSCYNESAYVINTLDVLRSAAGEVGLTYEIIVIDDCSRDDSVAKIKAYIDEHPEENILFRVNARNKGWAQNYFDAAFLGKGKYFRPACGDNSEPKESIVAVLKLAGKADIIVPYYSKVINKSLWRRVVSKVYVKLVNLISGHRLQYYNGLVLHLRYNIMRWHPNTRGFGFSADLLCHLLDLGFSYKEVPIIGIENKRERSSAITFKNMLSVTHTIVDIALRRISNWVYKKR